jgi:L-amino acid N-acyltransferase YncA
VGHIRFDLAAVAEISIVVAPEHRGGTGSSLLGAAVTRWRADHGNAPLRARVRTGNLASRRSFERAGFDLQAEADGILAYRLDGGPGRPEPATRRSTG